MTEAEWLACGDTESLMRLAGEKATRRKRILFACACCRRIWHLLSDTPSRRGVELAEILADKPQEPASEEAARLLEAMDSAATAPARGDRRAADRAVHFALRAAVEEDWQASASARRVALALEGEELIREQTARLAADGVQEADIQAANDQLVDGWEEAWMGSGRVVGWTGLDPERSLAAILREVVNPFRSPHRGLPWLTSAASGLAQAASEGRHAASGHLDPARLAVLADAVEEAGCTDASILAHLRSPGPHVRGCWALDLVLGKE